MSMLTKKLAGVVAGVAPTTTTEGETDVTKELKTQGELESEVTPDESKGAEANPEVQDDLTAKAGNTKTETETKTETTEKAAPETTDDGTKTAESTITLDVLAKSIADLAGVVQTLVEIKTAPEVAPEAQDELARKSTLDEATAALNAARTELESKTAALSDLELKAKDAQERYDEIMQRALPRPDALKGDVDLQKLAGFISDPAFSAAAAPSEDGFVGKSQEDFLK